MRSHVRLATALVGIVCFTGCGNPTPGGPAWLPAWVAVEIPASDNSADATWARIAREAPGGFAGFYVDPEKPSRIVVRMTRPREWASLRPQLARYIGPDLAADPRLFGAIASGARWNASDLYGARSYAAQKLLSLAGGVRSIAINPMANAVEVGVNPADVPAAKRMLRDADVPSELVHVVGETVCSDSMAWAVEVLLADSASGRPVNDSALVVLQGPMAADSARGNPTDPAWPIVVGNGVWGEFELLAARAGYESQRVHVVVPTDGCHPLTQRLRLVLSPPT